MSEPDTNIQEEIEAVHKQIQCFEKQDYDVTGGRFLQDACVKIRNLPVNLQPELNNRLHEKIRDKFESQPDYLSDPPDYLEGVRKAFTAFHGFPAAMRAVLEAMRDKIDERSRSQWNIWISVLEDDAPTIENLLATLPDAENQRLPRADMLARAAERGSAEVIPALLKNAPDNLDRAWAIRRAIAEKHTAALRALLTDAPADTDRNVALEFAVDDNYVEGIRVLLERDSPSINREDALGIVARKGHIDAMRELFALGDKCEPLLRIAAFNGHVDVVKFLLEKAPQDIDRFDVLDQAAMGGHSEIIRLLLDGVDIDSMKSFFERATAKDRATTVATLLDNAPQAIEWGTLLDLAKTEGSVATLKVLLRKAPETVFAEDSPWCIYRVLAGDSRTAIRNVFEKNPDMRAKFREVLLEETRVGKDNMINFALRGATDEDVSEVNKQFDLTQDDDQVASSRLARNWQFQNQ